jgi:prevent-host-death family protein
MNRYSIAEARAHLTGLVDEAADGPIEITRRGRPVLVILSVAEYQRMRGGTSFFQAVQRHRKQYAGALDRGASWLPTRNRGRERNPWT